MHRIHTAFHGQIDIFGLGTRICADFRVESRIGYQLYSLSLAFGSDRGSGLDHIHADCGKFFCDFQFLYGCQRDARRLFPVTKGRVQETDVFIAK